jgi:hypothetical protein
MGLNILSQFEEVFGKTRNICIDSKAAGEITIAETLEMVIKKGLEQLCCASQSLNASNYLK